MLKKISYQACFVLLILFTQITTAANSLPDSRVEFSNDIKFVSQLYSKWMQYKCASLKTLINQMVRFDEYCLSTLGIENLKEVSLALMPQAEVLENKFNQELEKLKAVMGGKGYFYNWYNTDTDWLNEGISNEEKIKFNELAQAKPQAIALLFHLAELDYRYCIDLGQLFLELITNNISNETLRNTNPTEFAKKVAGRNKLHFILFSHLVDCKNLDDIIKRDLACLKTLTNSSKQSYTCLDTLIDAYGDLDFELSQRDLLGMCANPLSNMEIFAYLV